MLKNDVEQIREKMQREMRITEFLRTLTTKQELLFLVNELELEFQRRGFMTEKVDTYDTNPVGRTLANLMALLCELDFDMRMWNQIIEQMTQD